MALSYYDLILALIPIPVVAAFGVGEAGVAGLSLLILAHALFVRPPTNLSTLHPKE